MKYTIISFCISLLTIAGTHAQTTFLYRNEKLQADPFHLYVNPLLTQTDGYSFNDLKQALLAAERLQAVESPAAQAYTEQAPLSIYIAPSVYWLDDPDDPAIRRPRPGTHTPYALELALNHVRLIGLSDNPEHTILACNRGQTQGAEGNFTMLHLTGNDIHAENLTFGNYCNVDLEYSLNPSLNRKRRADAIVQAQLAICDGDRILARNCRFISRLNSCPFVGATRALFDNCYFECTDDALCGTGVYLHCRFTFFSGKPFYCTNGTGAVFLDCDLHSLVKGKQYLVKAGSPVTMVDCRWTSQYPDLQIAWTQDPTNDLRSYQYNLTLNGQPLHIDANRPYLTVDMSGKPLLNAYKFEARGMQVYNIYNLLRGNDGWDPLQQQALRRKIRKRTNLPPTLYTWLPTSLQLSHRAATLESGVDSLLLQGRAVRFYTTTAIPTETIRWSLAPQDSAYASLIIDENGNCLVKGTNREEEPRTVNVSASTESGLEAACVVTVLPRLLPSPRFTRKPIIRKGYRPTGNGLQEPPFLVVDYQLDLGHRADQSLVTWYRCTDANGNHAIPVAVSRLNRPSLQYALTPADEGHYIKVSVAPKHLRSLPGEAATALTDQPIAHVFSTTDTTETFCTDFTTFPTDYQPQVLPGFWTVDACKPEDTHTYAWQPDTTHCWAYGRGMDGAAQCSGLIQVSRGARLLYTPIGEQYGDMALTLTLAPCKGAGQGFGSATGQYLDIYIKFDTRTMSGYALRIIRTTKNDKAVDFQLMKYENGIATPISSSVSSSCYRTQCTIHLQAIGNRLTAHAETTAPMPDPLKPGVSPTVDLEAEILPNGFGGIGLQHTGSTGASATVLCQLKYQSVRNK